jgi:hypothetical protein
VPPPGPEPTIRVIARDGLRAAAAEIAVVLDGAPRLVATAPVEGETAAPTTAEALIEPGPPTRLTWTLRPAE